jgi:LAGLIDADG DNA endonuclease family protein
MLLHRVRQATTPDESQRLQNRLPGLSRVRRDTQGASGIACLEQLREFFGVGDIAANRRYDNHREHMLRYVVRRREDLLTTIIPFFRTHPMKSPKQQNFEKFACCVELMADGRHTTDAGIIEIAQIAQTMNRRSPDTTSSESSETIRQASRTLDDEMVPSAWRHAGTNNQRKLFVRLVIGFNYDGKASSEIPCRVSSDLHEWSNDLGAVSTRDPVKL